MTAYYNENDEFAAQWLRNLIEKGHIADGIVDTRSIRDVSPDDLADFTQCHFFAGIGVWSHALRMAGWPDDRPVWTGSCPCQPWSAAGKGEGFADDRHLWPDFHRLIAARKPDVVFGEQVASKDGLAWLDTVCADMEGSSYAIGAVDLCAAGVGAPHIRQRLWLFAERLGDDDDEGLEGQRRRHQAASGWDGAVRPVATAGELGGLADAAVSGSLPGAFGRLHRGEESSRPRHAELERHGAAGGLVHAGQGARPGPVNGFWRDADWLFCRDGKWRPVEPGTFPLAHGAAGRVGRLRAYGNAIVPQVASEVIAAFMECRP